MGEMPLAVNVQGQEAPVMDILKDVLWIPGLPCQLSSTGRIRRDGEEFGDSGKKESYLQFRKDEPKIPLAARKGFSALSAPTQGNGNNESSAHTSFANKKSV